jgi:uncharacterized membrane protein
MGRLQPDEALQSVSRESSLQLLRSPVLAGTLLLVTSQFLMIGAWEAVWAISLTDLGAATWTIGLSFTLFALPMAAFAPLGGSIAQRTGGLGLAVAGLSFATAASLLFAVFDSVAALIIVAMFIGVGAGFGYTAGPVQRRQFCPGSMDVRHLRTRNSVDCDADSGWHRHHRGTRPAIIGKSSGTTTCRRLTIRCGMFRW